MMKEALWGETEENRALWGETEENGGEKKDTVRNTNVLERREEAQERVKEVRRRNSDEEMESDDEKELDRNEIDVLASIISTAVKSDGFFRHQQVIRSLNDTVGVSKFIFHPLLKVGEGDLATEEKEKIVKELVQNKPALFLQRFGRFLRFTCRLFLCVQQGRLGTGHAHNMTSFFHISTVSLILSLNCLISLFLYLIFDCPLLLYLICLFVSWFVCFFVSWSVCLFLCQKGLWVE